MKKIIAFLFIALTFSTLSFAQSSDAQSSDVTEPSVELQEDSSASIREYQLKNSLLGFGTGSRLQGDLESAKKLLTFDIAGISLMTVGTISMVATDFTYKFLKAYVGELSKADYWISGSIIGAGVVVFITGRVFGWVLPEKFEVSENAEISLTTYQGNPALQLQVRW